MVNKRGLSPVIATVLLIMLTIAGIAILAGTILPFIRNSLPDQCLPNQRYLEIDNEFNLNCYDLESETYNVSIKVLSEEVRGISLVFVSADESRRIDIPPGEDGIKIIDGGSLRAPNKTETLSYSISSEDKFNKLEVYPILADNELCQIKEEVSLRRC